MKKLLMLLMTVTFGFAVANAQDESRLIITAGQFKNIVLGDGMKVVLVSAESLQTEIKGDRSFFEKFNVSVADGSLHIRPGRKHGNETVYVAVNQLEKLTVGQRTQVFTEGILRGNDIKVYVNEGSVARLRTTGEVNGFSTDGDYTVRKTERPVFVP